MNKVMKANETPKKIYLQVCGDCPQTDCENCKFEDLEDNVTWCKDRIFHKDIEYTRTDAFIEKAVKWLEDNTGKWAANIKTHGLKMVGLMVEEFKRDMKL